jgi:chromosome segregation ATPase
MPEGGRSTFTVFVIIASLVLALGGVISTLIMYAEYSWIRTGNIPVIHDAAPSKEYLDKMNSDTAALRKRLSSAETAASDLKTASKTMFDNITALQASASALETEKNDLEKTVAGKEKLVLELRGTLTNVTADYDNQVADLRVRLGAEEKKSKSLEADKARIERESSAREKKITSLLEEKERVIKIIGDLLLAKEQEKAALKLELEKRDREIRDLKAKLEEYRSAKAASGSK